MNHFNPGSICLLTDGRFIKVLDTLDYHPKKGGLIRVQFMDQDDCSFVEGKHLSVVEKCMGLQALMIFESHRSIHLRLNRLSKV